MGLPTLLPWRPDLVDGRAPSGPDRLRIRIEPALRCFGAVCSVACLAWIWRDRGVKHPAHGHGARMTLPLETIFAKEDKDRRACCGKHLGCHEIHGRIRDCSADSVAIGYGLRRRTRLGIKGKPPYRQRAAASGEIQPDLSRKIYLICRRLF